MMIPAPFLSRLAEQPIDLRLGADVDADRRLVEDEELGAVIEPFADHDLLLVAAGKARDQGGARGRLDLHVADLPVRRPGFPSRLLISGPRLRRLKIGRLMLKPTPRLRQRP